MADSRFDSGSDRVLKQHVIDELDWEPSLDSTHIGVLAENGVVTLTGYVASFIQKRTAEEAARRVKGVRAIAEKLEVRLPGADRRADDRIAQRALDVLDWDSTVPKGAIQVKVEAGVVTLSGTVDAHYQKTAAEQYIHRLGGVVALKNQIELRPERRPPPNVVRQQIERALARNARLEAAGIVVSMVGTKLILSGRVQGLHDREVVMAAARSAPGVTEIEDNLTIA